MNEWGLGIGDWGLGIGDWGLGSIPNPHFFHLNNCLQILIYQIYH